MDLNLLPIFTAIYQTKGVGAAAAQLKVSQPSVSGALTRLRKQFNDPLFIKTGRGMEPTPRAHQIAGSVQAILGVVTDELLNTERFDPMQTEREFRLAVTDLAEPWILAAVVNAFAIQAPHTRIVSVVRRSSELEYALATGEIDIAIGYLPELCSANIMSTSLVAFTFSSFVRSGHPLGGRTISMEEYSDVGQIAVESENRNVEPFAKFLMQKGIRRRIVVTTSHFLSVPVTLVNTDLMATLPTSTDGKWLFSGKVEPVFLPFEVPIGLVKMYWHRALHHSTRHAWVRNLCSTELRRFADHLTA